MRLFAALGSCLALFLSASGSRSAPAGSYVYPDADTVLMLQIADVRDGRVDATLSAVALDSDGKLSAGARPVAGTLRDGDLQLVSGAGGVRTLISGVIDEGAADLTGCSGGTSQTLVFEKQRAWSFTELSSKPQSSAATRQANLRADTFFARAVSMADGAASAAEFERYCRADKQLDCRRFCIAATKLNDGVKGLASLKEDEQPAYVRVDPSQTDKAQSNV